MPADDTAFPGASDKYFSYTKCEGHRFSVKSVGQTADVAARTAPTAPP